MNMLLAPVTFFTLIATLALTGCSGSQGSGPEAPTVAEQEEEAQAVPDLTGDWVFSNPEAAGDGMLANITDKTITVNWAIISTGMVGIYWVGSYDAPTSADEPYSWTSQRDSAATDTELLASSSATKDFTYENNTLRFEVSIQGESAIVEMVRQ